MKPLPPLKALLTALLVIFASPALADQAAPAPCAPDQAGIHWREQHAYSLGIQAYIYHFPLFYLTQLRYGRVSNPDPAFFAPFNVFVHKRKLTTAADEAGGSPNNDTLYSSAWVDLRQGPVILSVPAMDPDRYYTFQMADMYSDNFAYVGRRTTGSEGGHYAIVSASWQGELPQGVQALPPSPTPFAYVLGRTLVRGHADIPTVNALQDQYRLTLLQHWNLPQAPAPAPVDTWRPWGQNEDPLGAWRTINRALLENPPPQRDAALMKWFASIGVGPGLDLDALDEATRRGLARAQSDGLALLQHAVQTGGNSCQVNGWFYPPPILGRAGHHQDFLTRASQQALAGVVANDPEEAVYLYTYTDIQGQPLHGQQAYTVRFEPGQTPPVEGFWSLSLYDLNFMLVPNPLNRHSLGDRSPELVPDADGGLTLHIQHEHPGPEREPNWLPAPEAPFYIILRTYHPGGAIVNQAWQPPTLSPAQPKQAPQPTPDAPETGGRPLALAVD